MRKAKNDWRINFKFHRVPMGEVYLLKKVFVKEIKEIIFTDYR